MSAETGKQYTGPERRIDPENRMGLDFHVKRGLHRFSDRFIAPNYYTERIEMVINANFRNTGVHADEADRIKWEILTALYRFEDQPTPEPEQFLTMLEAQVETAAGVWTERYPLPNAPKKDRLIEEGRKWLASLPRETFNSFIKLCPKTAQFVVVPNVPVSQQIKLIGGRISCCHENWENVKSNKWKFGITNRADLPFDPAIYWKNPDASEYQRGVRNNEEMVAEYERLFTKAGLQLMPQDGYVPSAASVLAQGRVFSGQFLTIFKKPIGADFLPWGLINSGWVELGGNDPERYDPSTRCRPWIEGEMLD